MICKIRSLGMTIIVSTCSFSSSNPFSAISRRCTPSNANGLVTTATVSTPASLAIFAKTGAAPVPVPPPNPQVMNTISAPRRTSANSSLFSSAAPRPTSGFIPAPKPRVVCFPIWTLRSALEWCRDCASVLTATNSTPRSPLVIIR